jgi:restriction system protein
VTGWIEKQLNLPSDVTEATSKTGVNKFYNQVAWARQYLVWEGLLDDRRRGVWTLTSDGWKAKIDDEAARAIFLNGVRNRQPRSTAQSPATSAEAAECATAAGTDEIVQPDELRELSLLETLRSLPPFGFERICERLLREHGFEDVEVTQQSRDGGIDGFGTLRLSPFVSMRVAFQAKRYKGTVSRQDVGQFRNDLLGRAEKGVLITTGRYTRDAEQEASKPGAIPIELIDGERLVELFESREIGLKPKQVFEIDQAFFDQFR